MQVQEQADRQTAIRAAFPKEGLFAEKEWLLSPDAFPIDRKSLADLEQLGHRLFVFQRACNQLYQLSVKGKQPEWVARYLDAGKPKELIEFSRRKEIRDDLPQVIRPDLILTEKGYIIAEIDSVPGGIGLTGWLNQTYSSFDNDIIGDANGMLEGFRAVVPNGADIVISQESIKPYLEEKMWFALFWLQPLREFWRRELGDKYFIKLQEIIPYSWLLDPTPLPQHAVIPRLEIHDWREAAKFSQKDRDLLLKVSGFSPLGWGSRGIALGSDLPHADWEKRIERALATFESSPTILQQFHKGRLLEHSYWDPDSGELKLMKGRVRLCPYYFVETDRVKLRGALATIAPADKKFVHGMSEAILVPSKVQ